VNPKRMIRILIWGTVRLFIILVLLLGNASMLQAVTLDECIRAALDENPDLEAASCRLHSAEHKMKQALAPYYPWVTLSTTYSRTDNPTRAFMMELNQRMLNMRSPAFDPNTPDDTDNINTSIGFKYRLFDFGSRRVDYEMAKQGVSVAGQQQRALQNELIHRVTTYFYGARQARAFVTVQEKSVESFNEIIRVARARYRAGTTVKSDVLNLEVKLAEASENLIMAEHSVHLAVFALNTAIGKELVSVDAFSAEDTLSPIPPLPAYHPDDVANRPELKATDIMLGIRDNAVRKATRQYAPTVNAFGSWDWDGKNYRDTEDSYFVGANVEWNVFTGLYRYHSLAEARSDRKAARAELSAVRNHLFFDLKQSYLKAVEARKRLEVARKSVRSAEEALRITEERYRHKAADITELLTAEVGLTSIRMRAATAYYDYLIALSNVERARGSLVSGYVGLQE
jgi:outer membrane protein